MPGIRLGLEESGATRLNKKVRFSWFWEVGPPSSVQGLGVVCCSSR